MTRFECFSCIRCHDPLQWFESNEKFNLTYKKRACRRKCLISPMAALFSASMFICHPIFLLLWSTEYFIRGIIFFFIIRFRDRRSHPGIRNQYICRPFYDPVQRGIHIASLSMI